MNYFVFYYFNNSLIMCHLEPAKLHYSTTFSEIRSLLRPRLLRRVKWAYWNSWTMLIIIVLLIITRFQLNFLYNQYYICLFKTFTRWLILKWFGTHKSSGHLQFALFEVACFPAWTNFSFTSHLIHLHTANRNNLNLNNRILRKNK